MRFALPFRSLVWWPHIAAPLIGTAIFASAIGPAPVWPELLWRTAAFLASLVGTAAFGYWLNDCTDIATDRRAGKKNLAANASPIGRAVVLLALLLLGAAPWRWLAPAAPTAFALWLLLTGCLAAYSVPPLRLKTRPLLGVLCDMAYGHLLPGWLTLALFWPETVAVSTVGTVAFLVLWSCWSMAKGVRNILLHQISDRAGDKRAGERTFVVKYGGAIVALMINRVLLPLEWLLFFALLVALAPWSSLPLWGFVAFMGLQWLSIGLWWDLGTRWQRLYDKFWFLPNDFYEGWLPHLAAGVFVGLHRLPVWWLLAVLAVVPMALKLLRRGLVMIGRNLHDLRVHLRAYRKGRFGWMDKR